MVDLAPEELRPPAQHAAAVLYQGPIADAIRRFKYGGRTDLLPQLAPWLVEAALGHTGELDAVVPVPLHPVKLRARGWNPAALLARPVARAFAVPLRTGWLARTRATPAQAGLSRAARQRNVAGAFCSRSDAGRSCRVLLIDDVRTTGATLQEAARSLEAAGHTVRTLALAWANDDLDAQIA